MARGVLGLVQDRRLVWVCFWVGLGVGVGVGFRCFGVGFKYWVVRPCITYLEVLVCRIIKL